MAVVAKGLVEDLGSGLKLHCGTAYALIDQKTGQVLYALLDSGTRLAGLVGRRVEVIGERSDAYPAAECEVLEVNEVRGENL